MARTLGSIEREPCVVRALGCVQNSMHRARLASPGEVTQRAPWP